MKKTIKLCALILLSLNSIVSLAQQSDTLDIQRNDHDIVSFARFKPNANRKIQYDTLFLKSILYAKNEDSFKLISDISNESGGTHRKFQQYYKGIKVENAEYLIHARNGIIETINGNFELVKIPSVVPTLNEKLALSKAIDFVKSKKYKWEDEAYERFVKLRTKNPDTTYYPKGELVIVINNLNGGKNCNLAWKFRISSLNPDNEQWIYIDAISGEVVGNTPLIYDTNTTATAQTRYNNQNVSITTDSYTDGYRLSETRASTQGQSVNIHTWNCQNGSNWANSIDFSNTNTNWVTGSWSAINQDQVSLDAHWGEEMILDYWSIVRRRNSLNNQGLDINGYVHYYDASKPAIWPNNAQWDGVNYGFRYGNGDGIVFNPLVSLDVVAHEAGHGIAQFTAGFYSMYGYDECDALNEGFSDIWGATIENWASPNKQTWLMGEDIFATSAFNCIRDLQNPNSTTAIEGPHPDTYHGTNWRYDGEPHFNSTVLSHWFYLLSQGGTGWNNGLTSHATANNGYNWTVIGVGISNAARLAYITEAYYANSSSTYSSIRQNTITAAIDSFGVNSCQVINATNAWYAVGVGGQFQYVNVTISGPALICSSGGTFAVNNVPSGCTVTWTNSSNLNLTSSSGNTAVFAPNSFNGQGWVQARIVSTACGTSVPVPQYSVWVGQPQNPSITASLRNWGSYREIRLFATQIEGVSYEWKIDGNVQEFTGPFCSFIAPECGGNPSLIFQDYNVEVSVTNECGTTTTCNTFRFECGYSPTITKIGYCGGGGEELMAENDISILANPNPANNNVQISLIKRTVRDGKALFKNTSLAQMPDPGKKYKLRLINSSGVPVFNTTISNNYISVSTAGLINGYYFVEIIDGTKTYSQKFMVKH